MDKPDDLEDDMRPEYEFSKMKSLGRGIYAERIRKEGATIRVERTVVLDAEVNDAFPTSEALNAELWGLMKSGAAPAPPAASGG